METLGESDGGKVDDDDDSDGPEGTDEVDDADARPAPPPTPLSTPLPPKPKKKVDASSQLLLPIVKSSSRLSNQSVLKEEDDENREIGRDGTIEADG